jgi:endonuclease YncB( thermonuclease family)
MKKITYLFLGLFLTSNAFAATAKKAEADTNTVVENTAEITETIMAGSDKSFGTVEVAEVTSIYDGDTFRANIKNYPPIVGERIGIRVNGIDTPEMRGKCEQEKKAAQAAKQFSVDKLRGAKKIELRNMKRDKYFRILADVFIDGENLATLLLKAKLGVEYHGETKQSWCDAKK